ncbi:tripartite motif-containing protein 2-like [Saccoglossus kowalevskii]
MSDDLEDDDVRRSFKEDMLTCQLCFEVYTDPKLLPCQHSFCEICLEKWVQTKRGQLSCPCCRATCPLPDDGVKCLPRNIMLGSFIDYVVRPEQKRTGDNGIQTCEVCGPGTKTHSRCLDCAQYLCSKCCRNKSRYSRDFLLGLQYHPQSLGKLIGLDHVTKTCPGVLVEETLLDRTAKILEDVMKDYYSLVNAAKNINTPIIITEEGLKAVVNLIYQNATSCPGYVDKFVQLCGHLMNVEVPSKMHFSSTVTFKVILRNKCEEEFQKGCDENKALLNAPNTLQRRNDTQELHVKSLGCVAFIGKLFCFSIIEDEVIIHRYLHTLLADQDQYSLECACKLLSHYVIRNVNSQLAGALK